MSAWTAPRRAQHDAWFPSRPPLPVDALAGPAVRALAARAGGPPAAHPGRPRARHVRRFGLAGRRAVPDDARPAVRRCRCPARRSRSPRPTSGPTRPRPTAPAGSGSSRSTARSSPAPPRPGSAFGVPYHHAAVTSRIDGDWIAHTSRCTHSGAGRAPDPLPADRPGSPRAARWPRGVPHRPDGPVRGPPRPADGDAGRARRLAAPGRGGRVRAQHDGRAVRHRAAVDPAASCSSPAAWTPSRIVRRPSSP